jgi:phage N-6-adenine-methyltransferase
MNEHDLKTVMGRKATGGTDNWRTPSVVLDLVRQLAGGSIGLDPCTDDANPTKADRFYFPPTDGLRELWRGFGMVFVNPPYSDNAEWLNACVRRFMVPDDSGDQCVALVPARTDTRWWHGVVFTARLVCFWRGRLRFEDPESPTANSAPFPSALLYWGSKPEDFARIFGPHGWIVRTDTSTECGTNEALAAERARKDG